VATMGRYDLSDEVWARLAPLLPPERGHRGRPFRPHRAVVNGILWILHTGAPWRDLPPEYPPFGTCHWRLTAWQRDGTWARVLQELQGVADARGDLAWAHSFVDATVVRAHPDAAGARHAPAQAQGRKQRGALARSPGKRSGAVGED